MRDDGIARLRTALGARRPRTIPLLPGMRRAAVAVIARSAPSGDVELLFIRRPERRGDRWSGDVAFPGGLMTRVDGDEVEAARREAHEEVGVELGEPLGRLGDLVTLAPGSARPMRLRPIVFATTGAPELRLDTREVAETTWHSWHALGLLEPKRVERRIAGVRVHVRGHPLAGGLLWGLTLAMCRELARLTSPDHRRD